ncbi:MAG: hypothetical protein ACRD01_00795 [Terriglobales bacterium]
MISAALLAGAWLALVPAPQAAVAPPPALATVQRIYVEPFGQDKSEQAIQAMVITALVDSKRFTVTENRSRADAVLQGSAIERSSQEVHAYGSGTGVGQVGGAARVHSDGSGSGAVVGRSLGASDSSLDTETDTHATVSVRLVSKDGDIIWSTTQQSGGGKYEGAGASAADACIKQLLQDARASTAPH